MSRSAFIDQILNLETTECEAAPQFFYALDRALRLFPVKSGFSGHQPRHRLAAPCDQDFLSRLNPVEQSAELVLGLKGANFTYDPISSNKPAYRLAYRINC